jgi:hypothetical protein
METASLIYHFSVMIIAIVMFFMKLTAPNAIFELILKAVGKIVPLFCMLYAGIQIFKYFGIM